MNIHDQGQHPMTLRAQQEEADRWTQLQQTLTDLQAENKRLSDAKGVKESSGHSAYEQEKLLVVDISVLERYLDAEGTSKSTKTLRTFPEAVEVLEQMLKDKLPSNYKLLIVDQMHTVGASAITLL